MSIARQALANVAFNAFPVLDLVLRIAATTATLALGFVLFVAAVTLGDRTGNAGLAMLALTVAGLVALGLPVLAYQGADWLLKRLDNVLRIA
ncbi:hypothetical protein [Paraburkholderia tropica]|uniref:hypothetical protein n=1 Tax=Paraburkholderia tropica TaxID=92647 RepID=UPI0007ED7BAA|nr:hypothetical protein [Paraburkholderia tropica]OBR53717.1 hypothetical protein A6456_12350 [Paraburkholderia tropica]